MSEKSEKKPLSWAVIIGAMILTGIVAGITFGLIDDHFHVRLRNGGIGAAMGVVGGILIVRRQKTLQS